MGGHGALTLYLNSILSGAKQYRSVSAFSPVANPTNCPWGQKAFNGYLQGGVEEAKERYDATELIKKLGKAPVHILIDYVSVLTGGRIGGGNADVEGFLKYKGTGDNFYKTRQLLPENFLKAARDAGYDEVQVRVRAQEGYDHSYYFVRLVSLSAVCLQTSQRFFVGQMSTFGADHVHCEFVRTRSVLAR